MRQTLLSFVDDCARRGDEMALAHRRGLRVERWTYARLATLARQTARELAARGVTQGDRVLLWAENSPAWVAAFFGCLLRGAIVVPLDAESAPDFAARVCSQVGAKLLFCGAVAAESLTATMPSLRLAQLAETVARHPDAPFEHEEGRAVQMGPEDIAEIIYTSGTTAEPKGVVLTHANLLANVEPIEREIAKYRKWERLVHPLRFMSLVPLSHVFGQFMGMFIPQLLGAEVFLQESLKPSEVVSTVRRERASVVVAVPRLLDTLRERIERGEEARGRVEAFRCGLREAARWSWPRRWWHFRRIHGELGWKFWAFVVGGATLAEETEQFWRRLGYAIVQGYGMTETASLVSVNHPFAQGRGSIGKTLPGQEVRLGAGGEILVRGANVARGYWGTNGLQAASDEEGWLRTGDVAEFDGAGRLFFKGRQKEVIVTAAGLNVYPDDLEAALNAQPEVRASCVVALEGARGPEACAVLVLRGADADATEVVRRANAGLARHQQIRRWLVWPEGDLPRTPTQKVRRGEVERAARMRLAGGSAARTRAAGGSDPLAEIVARISGEAPARLDAEAKLTTDLKLDSLGRVELLGALEERFQIELDEAALTAATTLGDVQRMILRGDREECAALYPYPRWPMRAPATWARRVLFYAVVLPLVRWMARPTVRGRKQLESLGRGPALFVANHVTMADHALIMAALPRRLGLRLAVAMEGELLRDWRFPPAPMPLWRRAQRLAQYALVVLFFNVFPLPKKSGFRRSFAHAGEAMDRGFSVLVFPEGRRSDEGHMNTFMAGAGLLVAELGAPVVPVRIDGLYELKRERRYFAGRGEVILTFGEPISFAPDDDPARIAEELGRRVSEL